MKLIKQDEVGVWIKASEEMPELSDNHEKHFRVDGKKAEGMFLFIDGKVRFEQYSPLYGYVIISDYSRIEWLKPIKDVFVLIEDELKEITGDAMNYYCSSNEEKGLLLLNEQFIKEITKQ